MNDCVVSTLPHPELIPWLCQQLRLNLPRQFASGRPTDEQIAQAVWRSLCFWVIRDGQALGFARVITDHATFSFVTDVFVIEQERGKGLGRQLMQAVVDHPSVGRTISILDTRSAEGLYTRFGYVRNRTIMQREPDR